MRRSTSWWDDHVRASNTELKSEGGMSGTEPVGDNGWQYFEGTAPSRVSAIFCWLTHFIEKIGNAEKRIIIFIIVASDCLYLRCACAWRFALICTFASSFGIFFCAAWSAFECNLWVTLRKRVESAYLFLLRPINYLPLSLIRPLVVTEWCDLISVWPRRLFYWSAIPQYLLYHQRSLYYAPYNRFLIAYASNVLILSLLLSQAYDNGIWFLLPLCYNFRKIVMVLVTRFHWYKLQFLFEVS